MGSCEPPDCGEGEGAVTAITDPMDLNLAAEVENIKFRPGRMT